MQRNLKDIDFYQLYKKWYLGCEMFECFVHATPFVTLKNYPDFLLSKVDCEMDSYTTDLLGRILPYVDSESEGQAAKGTDIYMKTVFFLDLPATFALKAAYLLQKELELKPILTFRQINHPYGLIFDETAINTFVAISEKVTEQNSNGFVFLLDSLRYGDYDENTYKKHFNNQYELSEYDLPVFEMLRDLGYSRLVFLSQGAVKEDIKPYLEYLKENGIQVVVSELNYSI